MNRISTKSTAESVLRELPSVLGAHVSEDPEGQPREIHLLVRPGPEPAALARDIRGLLEERLGMPIDQRVISIAQLERDPDRERPAAGGSANAANGHESSGGPGSGEIPGGREPTGRGAGAAAPTEADLLEVRPVFLGMETRATSGQITVTVRLEWQGIRSEGTADALDTQPGRARAAAEATLRSARDAPWNDDLDLELDFASIVAALDAEYVLVSALAMSDRLGRRPLGLVGAHPVESDVESAAALATLKAINRVLSRYSSVSSDRSAK